MKKICSLFILLAVLVSCSDDNKTPLLSVTPNDFFQYVDSSQIVHFQISASAAEDRTLNRFTITYATKFEQSRVLFDTIINNTKKFNFNYDYKIPVFNDSTDVYITFDLYDNEGENHKIAKILSVKTFAQKIYLLTEYAGNVMYTDPAFHGTAFNLSTCNLLSDYTDSTAMHLFAEIDTLNPSTLQLKWTSPAKLNFVRFNGYDYANATSETAKTAYDAGAKIDFISTITNNDIYITKLSSSNDDEYVVIKVTNIFDNTDSKDDMYMFNVKK
ncbi:MAG: hypothetical protein JXQ69_08970 [Paludibacteraceae bacterium]|nr:hypothetical protein [Paludibacteraceae bacterium]MBN2788435.1 hypothetical protein [Paludibacteraceae bacterium]